MKNNVDKLHSDKLTPLSVDLNKLSNVIKNGVVKKTEYSVNIKNIEGKIHDITNLVTKDILNTKVNEV